MSKKLIICVLIISFLSLLQSCCTLTGYMIGKSIDEKSKSEIPESSTDVSMVFTDSSVTDSTKTSESDYKSTLFLVGVAADIFLVYMLKNSINVPIGLSNH